MKNTCCKIGPLAAVTILALAGSTVKGQEVYSQIVGAISIDLPAESDVIVSFPFKQSAEFRGTVESASENGGLVLSVATDSLTSESFDQASGVSTHYLVIESGTQMGVHLDIVSNTTSQVTLNGGESAGIQNGDEIAIYPHWTLSSAFPLGVANEDADEPGVRSIEVIVPEGVASEGNMIPDGIYYFSGGAWRQVGAGIDSVADSAVLRPGRALVIRNNDGEAKNALFFGEVIDSPIAIPLAESTDYASDNFVGLNRPLAIALNELGLAPGGVFEETTDPENPNDLLLVYSNEATGKNKKPSASYFYYNGAWRLSGGDNGVDRGADTIEPGMGIAVRKIQVGSNPQDSNWVNEWELPQ